MSTVSSSTSSTNTSSTTSTLSELGDYETWLSILATTMENQNPLDPADTNELMAQLTSYAQLEQQVAINDNLTTIIDTLDASGLTTGVAYLGLDATMEGDEVTVEDDGTVDASWTYDLDTAADSVTLTVSDSDGNTVYETSGDTGSGSHTFSWDGTDSDGETVDAGQYTLTVTATDSSGSTVSSTIYVTGTITGADSSSGSLVLYMGDTELSADDITRLGS